MAIGLLQIETPWDSTETGDDGAFEFSQVLEGDWRIQASGLSAMSRYNTRRAEFADLRVGKSDVDNVSIRLPQLFEIAVSADWSESQAGDQPEIPVLPQTFLLPMDGQPFTILNIKNPNEMQPGRYLIAPGNVLSGYYVAAEVLDGRDVLGQVAEFTGPATLQMVYKKDGGSVRGTIEKGGGTTVVLMSDAANSPRFAYNGRCDATGNFSIRRAARSLHNRDIHRGSVSGRAVRALRESGVSQPSGEQGRAGESRRRRDDDGNTDAELNLTRVQSTSLASTDCPYRILLEVRRHVVQTKIGLCSAVVPGDLSAILGRASPQGLFSPGRFHASCLPVMVYIQLAYDAMVKEDALWNAVTVYNFECRRSGGLQAANLAA
jgi:hypothetical protein